MLECLIYALRKTAGKTCYNDRVRFIEDLDFDKDELIKDGVIDSNLLAKGEL